MGEEGDQQAIVDVALWGDARARLLNHRRIVLEAGWAAPGGHLFTGSRGAGKGCGAAAAPAAPRGCALLGGARGGGGGRAYGPARWREEGGKRGVWNSDAG